MRLADYHRRSLAFHMRTNAAVTLGVAVGAAALTGALLVGDSMRGSLREAAIGRLGAVDLSLVSNRLFREQLADVLANVVVSPSHLPDDAVPPSLDVASPLVGDAERERAPSTRDDAEGNQAPPTRGDATFVPLVRESPLAPSPSAPPTRGDATFVPLVRESPLAPSPSAPPTRGDATRHPAVAPSGLSLFGHTAPALLLAGGTTHATTQARANQVNVLGVDERFWALRGDRYGDGVAQPQAPQRSVILNEPLARELNAKVGDDVLVRLGKPSAVSTETLLGRRDDTTVTLRLPVAAILPARDLGAFSLSPRQFLPKNAYIPLPTLQRAIDKPGRANALLVGGTLRATDADTRSLQHRLDENLAASDFGLTIRVDEQRGYISLESEAMLIEPVFEQAARSAAEGLGWTVSPLQTYLANRIDKGPPPRDSGPTATAPSATSIPYSTVTALDPTSPIWSAFQLADGGAPPSLKPGEIALNRWAADDLGAAVGDRVSLSYYITGPYGQLDTETSTFTLAAIVALNGPADDPGLTPPYKGVTDTKSLADWNPPFPMDLKLIRDKDEAYWEAHRATPKAFITLEDGKRLWAHDADRLGSLTAIRLTPPEGGSLSETAGSFEERLVHEIDPKQAGLSFDPVRARLLAAAEGATDFGMLFVSFSFFLIASAAMLVALLFRLGVERRASEIGLLLATGFSPGHAQRMLIAQGTVLATAGAAVGILGALAYAWLMLAGLRSWWSDAVHTPFLRLHGSATTYIIGFVASMLVSLGSIAWSIRGLTRRSARSLLAGDVEGGGTAPAGRGRLSFALAVLGFALAIVMTILPFLTDAVPQTAAFFGAGSAMLLGCLATFGRRLRTEHPGIIHAPGRLTWVRLGTRNARRHPGRSILTASLIASACFLIAALEAFNIDAHTTVGNRTSGTGGYTLFAESAAPLLYDLNTAPGREKQNVTADRRLFDGVTVTPFRLRPGDASSCLNLYVPTKPRILGATPAAIERGGFEFAATIDTTALPPPFLRGDEEGSHRPLSGVAERPIDNRQSTIGNSTRNPWELLRLALPDEAIPVIGDEAAVLWQLHLGLGKDLITTDERGREVRLRFVALLKGSMLQDELIVSEENFRKLFPSIGGYAFFLIDAPQTQVAKLEHVLETDLAPFSFDVGRSADRLVEYLAVQNTYLSTFQTLGGFGLVLGTIGLAAVLLRNVWERRGELALLRALGFSRTSLGWIVLSENVALLVVGLTAGVASAMLAIAPHVVTRPASMPWMSLGLTLLGVLVVGVGAGAAAMIPALRAPLIGALRSE